MIAAASNPTVRLNNRPPARYVSHTASVPSTAATTRATTNTLVGSVAYARLTASALPNHSSNTMWSR